jgi:hypothetical protein
LHAAASREAPELDLERLRPRGASGTVAVWQAGAYPFSSGLKVYRMTRRLIIFVSVLLLALAHLPTLLNSSAFDAFPCCTGIMCPMHHVVAAHADCDMTASRQPDELQPCPEHALHYTAALVFVGVALPVLFPEPPAEAARAFVSRIPPSAELAVALPPPRTFLA